MSLGIRNILIVFSMFWGAKSFALILQEDGPSVGQMVVDFHVLSEDSKSRWIVRALEQNFIRDLGIYPRIRPIDKSSLDFSACQKNLQCSIKVARDAQVDIYLYGEGQGNSVSWKVYDASTGSKMAEGELTTGPNASRRQLKLEAFHAVSSFVEKGGILDQRAIAIERKNLDEFGQKFDRGQLPFGVDRWVQAQKKWVIFTIAIMAIMAFIYLYTKTFGWRKILKSRADADASNRIFRERERLEKEQENLPSDPSEVFDPMGRRTSISPYPLIPLRASKYFGLVLLLTFLSLILLRPGLFGLHEVLTTILEETGAMTYLNELSWVTPLIAGILWAFWGNKVARFVFPSLAGFELLHPAGVFSTLRSWLVVSAVRTLALAVFFLPFSLLTWVAVRALSIPLFTVSNPFVPMMGLGVWILAGLGMDLLSQYFDQEAVDGPASEEHPWNIVLHSYLKDWLDDNDLPHDLEGLKRIIFLPGHASDLIIYGGAFSPTRVVIHEKILNKAFRDEKYRHKVNPEDLMDRDDIEAKDFLAGVLLVALSQVHRQNQWIHCITFLVRKARKRASKKITNSWSFLEKMFWPAYSKNPARLVDSYVCSHGCLDHLIQFLAYQLFRDSRHLTLNADRNQLRHQSLKIIDRTKRDARFFDLPDQRILSERLLWVGRFVESAADDITKNTKFGWQVLLVTLLIVGVFIGATVRESYLYHPIYEERMAMKEQELKEKAEKWRKKNDSSQGQQR